MKLHNVTNIDGLFEVLDQAQGEVMLETADGARYGWTAGRQILRSMASNLRASRLRHLSLHFENTRDANSMIQFLMERQMPARTA